MAHSEFVPDVDELVSYFRQGPSDLGVSGIDYRNFSTGGMALELAFADVNLAVPGCPTVAPPSKRARAAAARHAHVRRALAELPASYQAAIEVAYTRELAETRDQANRTSGQKHAMADADTYGRALELVVRARLSVRADVAAVDAEIATYRRRIADARTALARAGDVANATWPAKRRAALQRQLGRAIVGWWAWARDARLAIEALEAGRRALVASEDARVAAAVATLRTAQEAYRVTRDRHRLEERRGVEAAAAAGQARRELLLRQLSGRKASPRLRARAWAERVGI